MAPRQSKTDQPKTRRKPAKTPEAREQQLISMAIDASEELIQSGKAPAPVLTHYLKMGSSREKLEQEKLRQENELLKAKIKTLESVERQEAMYKEALDAMSNYKGNRDDFEYND